MLLHIDFQQSSRLQVQQKNYLGVGFRVSTVAHNCHSRKEKRLTAERITSQQKEKDSQQKEKDSWQTELTSRQKEKPHGKKKKTHGKQFY